MPISAVSAADGRRFRPTLVPTVAAAIVIVATVLLGNWQARRADLRGDLQAQARTMAQESPMPLLRAADADPGSRYRRATAAGEFVAEGQIWLDNRTYKGAAGYHVLTPLRLADGSHLLVDRGWIATTARHEAPAAAPLPGLVHLEGRLNLPPSRFLELKHLAPAGGVWQNLDLAEYAKVTGISVAPMVLEQAPGAADGLVRDWPAPELGRDKNVVYMWQWYGFASLTLVLWLVFSWRRP